MAEFPVEIHFNSVAEFEAVYRAVKQDVLLFEAMSGSVLAANMFFWQKRNGQKSNLNIKEVFEIPFHEDGRRSEHSLQAGGGSDDQFFPEASAVKLAGEPVKIYFGQGQIVAGRAQVNHVSEQAEKYALLNEVYHRVKNNLNIIVSLLSLQLNRVSEPYTRHLLLESKSRIYTLSLLQQKLYSSSRISEIKVGSYLQSLALSVISTFRKPGMDINLRMEAEEEWLNIDTLIPVGLVTHELVTNAVLHAFSEHPKAEITIIFKKTNEGQYLLEVSDNGKGLPENKEPEDYNSLGFQLVKNLLRQLKTGYAFKSEQGGGTRFSVQFKEK